MTGLKSDYKYLQLWSHEFNYSTHNEEKDLSSKIERTAVEMEYQEITI